MDKVLNDNLEVVDHVDGTDSGEVKAHGSVEAQVKKTMPPPRVTQGYKILKLIVDKTCSDAVG